MGEATVIVTSCEYEFKASCTVKVEPLNNVETGDYRLNDESTVYLYGHCYFKEQDSSNPVRGFEYSDTDLSTSAKDVQVNSDGSFESFITFLIPNTKYYYRAYAIVNGIREYGDVKFFTTPSITFPDVIDMGLSVKWSSFNIGAKNPEESERYIAWGEMGPQYNYYSFNTYKWCNGSNNALTKYCNNPSYGVVDNKTALELEDDVANAWLGGKWRIPTSEEFSELINNCDVLWTTQNGVNGMKFTSKKNGNTLFLSASGFACQTGLLGYGSEGFYWSSSLHSQFPDDAIALSIHENEVTLNRVHSRCFGYQIRPVLEP